MDNQELKSILDGISTTVAAFGAKADAIQRQVDAIDVQAQNRHFSAGGSDPRAGLVEIKRVLSEQKDSLYAHGRLRFEVPTLLPEGKSTILSTGLTSTEPTVGIQGAGRYPYRLRSLFRTVETSFPTIGVLRSNVETLNVSPQAEGNSKSESTMSFTLAQLPIQTLATFVNFSRQAMDDLDGFTEFINATLVWALEAKAEAEILSGSGTGAHLSGVTTFATAYDTTILPTTGWNRVDVLGAAACQLQEAGYSPNFAVISPRNWFQMVSLKDSLGQYVLASPRTTMGERAYGLTILPSAQMLGNTFVVGDSSKAIIRQRQRTTVQVSFEHGNNFTSNLATALAEERFGIETLRPDAFVTGTLDSSPA